MIEHRQQNIELSRLFAVLGRYKGLMITFCLVATLSSLGITYVMSEQYEANATLFYQPSENVSFQQKAKDALGFPLPLVPLETIANTLEDMVKGDAVLEKTVRTLKLDVKTPRKPASAFMNSVLDLKDTLKDWRRDAMQMVQYGRLIPEDPVRGAIENLRKNLTVARVNKAYTIRLEVRDQEPDRAAKIVETLAGFLSDAVVQEQTRTSHESRMNIEGRLAQAQREVENLRATLANLKSTRGISSLDDEVTLRLKTLNSFQEDRSKFTHDLRALEDRRAQLALQLKDQSALVNFDSTVAHNRVFDEFRMERSRLEVERAGLLERLTPESNEVRAVEARLAEAKEKLSAEPETLVSSETSHLNEVRQKVESDLLSVTAEIEGMRAREKAIGSSIQTESDAVRSLIENEPVIKQTNLRLAAAEQSYELMNGAYQEALTTESKSVREVTMMGSVLVPTAPVRPIKILHVSVTFLLGIALAIGCAFLAHYFDSTLYDAHDAEKSIDLPVLAAVPMIPRSRGVFRGNSG